MVFGESSDAPLHGDVLESILSHVSTIDLLPALRVSRSWRRSALASLGRRPRHPFLFVHLLHRHSLLSSTAYDPHSRSWHPLTHVPPPLPLTCRLVQLHPLPATWPLLPQPLLHRRDALAALVGRRVILAGGTCLLGDRTCAVECISLDSPSPAWIQCKPIPEILLESAAATWLAVAASDRRMYVLERGPADSARLAWFDPGSDMWGPVRPLRLGGGVVSVSAIGVGPAADGRDWLIAVGKVEGGGLGVWEVDPESLEIREIGRMPAEVAARIAGEGALGFSNVGCFGFLYDLGGRGEVFRCEFGDGKWRWECIGKLAAVEEDPTARVFFRCAMPAVADLKVLYERRR